MGPKNRRIPFTSGGEHDALSRRSRHIHIYRAGDLKKIKRRYNKRFRKAWRGEYE